jgi:hypothetical protein
MSERQWHLSASAISAFKACPYRWFLGYVEGLRKKDDTVAQRQGTNWHGLHEQYENARSAGREHDAAFDVAIEWLNEMYEQVPANKSKTEWATEREILAAAFAAYCWYWGTDQFATIATELKFDLPLHHPATGMPCPPNEVIRVGKIDRVVEHNDGVMQFERKSTSQSIDPDSAYWSKLKLDTQVSFYDLALCDMVQAGIIDDVYGPRTPVRGCLYDVWHRPKLEPKMLTQADTAALIETGEYCGTQFTVSVHQPEDKVESVTVDGWDCEIKPGKKGFAVSEVPPMFGARLLKDICERPEFYFQRREIARTDRERTDSRRQFYAIYRMMRTVVESQHIFQNEQQCDATFRCSYIDVCWQQADVSDGKTPPGFKRIFTETTTTGESR